MQSCRLCNKRIKKFLSLESHPLPEEFRSKKQINDLVKRYPLGLSYCLSCGHVQLSDIVDPAEIYRKNYFYDYSVTEEGVKHWKSLAQSIIRKYKLTDKDLVVDIGSNTGMLLSLFKTSHAKVLGVDPAIKQVSIAGQKGIETVNDFFSPEVAEKIVEEFGKARVIICTNTFDHVDDLSDFTHGIVKLMDRDGVFIIEVPYFLKMIQSLTHVVYHQQIDYICLKPLVHFFRQFGMEIFDAEEISMHGGSIRLSVGVKKQHSVSRFVINLIDREEEVFTDWDIILEGFAARILSQRDQLRNTILDLKAKGATIGAAGASAKGITLLNYCGLDRKHIEFISEKSPLKIGRFTPSGIPVVSDGELLLINPDYVLVLAWNFCNEVMKNLAKYKKSGGKFIIPIPKIKIIN
jgi:2-polyprenyl-3-methyl-5-hydroxy-6-metoxy-1,4-benzoquinol methylase